jgi:hypothetical protein
MSANLNQHHTFHKKIPFLSTAIERVAFLLF